jgi:hypothetical protein
MQQCQHSASKYFSLLHVSLIGHVEEIVRKNVSKCCLITIPYLFILLYKIGKDHSGDRSKLENNIKTGIKEIEYGLRMDSTGLR